MKCKYKKLLGRTIVDIRQLTMNEVLAEGWEDEQYSPCLALVLDNGTLLYASRDEEGNGPGCIFGTDKTGEQFQLA